MKHVLLIAFLSIFSIALRAQKAAKVDLSIYPNPATEYITVQDDNEVVKQVLVFNLVGKKVKTFDFVKYENYNITDLPKGMYLVQIIDKSSKVLNTQKLNKR